MKLIPFYQQVLTALGLKYDNDGFVSRVESENGQKKLVPLTIKDQRLVLPVDFQLEDPNWEHRIGFNPLYESLARKDSPIHEALRTIANMHLNAVMGIIAGRLLMISRDTGIHPHLSPEQTVFLDHVKKADEKTFKQFSSLLDAFPADRCMINIYSKAGASIKVPQADGTEKAEKFARAAIVSFPLYEALAAAEGDQVRAPAKNVTVSKKNIETLKSLLEYMVPNIGKKDQYHVGTLSKMAPTLETLLNATAVILNYTNAELELFKDRIPEAQDFIAPMDWANDLVDNIGPLYAEARNIGMLQGNEGVAPGAPEPQQKPAQQYQQTAQAEQAAPQPAPAKAPAKIVQISPITGKPVDVDPPKESTFTRTPAQAASQWNAQPQQSFNGSGFQGFQPAQPAQPQVKSNGKVDLASLVNSNQALANQLGMQPSFNNNGWGTPTQSQGRTPGWAKETGFDNGNNGGGWGNGNSGGGRGF